MLTLIIALSAILWYLIDRFKPMWSELKYGNYITVLISAIGGFAFSFGYQLDLLYASGLVEKASILGIIITGLTLMSGSSAVAEVIERIRGKKVE